MVIRFTAHIPTASSNTVLYCGRPLFSRTASFESQANKQKCVQSLLASEEGESSEDKQRSKVKHNRPRPTISARTAALRPGHWGLRRQRLDAVLIAVLARVREESAASVWVLGGNRGGTDRANARKDGSKSTKGQTTESKWSRWLKRGEISSNHKYSWPGRKLYKERFFRSRCLWQLRRLSAVVLQSREKPE